VLSSRSVAPVSGLLAAVEYPVLVVAAFVHYPYVYSPTKNWLSDLGNPVLNPRGAICYDVGAVVTGLLLMPFFLGFSRWRIASNDLQRVLVRLTQIFGLLGAVGVVLSGLFTETLFALHCVISAFLFIFLGAALIFSLAALRYAPTCPRWLLAIGTMAAVLDVCYGTFQNVHLLEWITTALFLSYVCLLGLATRRVPLA
jgi:hypothetical membrane protein